MNIIFISTFESQSKTNQIMEQTQLELQPQSAQTSVVDPQEFGIDTNKGLTISQSFAPKIVERDGYVAVYEQLITKELTKEVCKEASDLRKKLVKVRTGIADIHKTEKAFYLASGKYIDALKNKLTLPVEQMEAKLTEIEDYFENLEKERIKQLNDSRIALVAPYVDDATNLKLSDMEEDVFAAYLLTKKNAYEAKVAEAKRIEEERLAAIEAEKAEQERIRKENEDLKAEADRKAKELEEERRIAAEKQKAIEDAAKAETDRLAKIAAEEKAKQDAIIAKQKAEADRLAKELQAQKDAAAEVERKRLAAEEAERKRIEAEQLAAKKEAEKLAKAPVKKQLTVWVDGFTFEQLPETLADNDAAKSIMAKFEAFKNWAKSEIEKL